MAISGGNRSITGRRPVKCNCRHRFPDTLYDTIFRTGKSHLGQRPKQAAGYGSVLVGGLPFTAIPEKAGIRNNRKRGYFFGSDRGTGTPGRWSLSTGRNSGGRPQDGAAGQEARKRTITLVFTIATGWPRAGTARCGRQGAAIVRSHRGGLPQPGQSNSPNRPRKNGWHGEEINTRCTGASPPPVQAAPGAGHPGGG